MAKANVNKTIEVNLVLDEQEAEWLRAFIQNSYKTETPKEMQTRKDLFDTLSDALGYATYKEAVSSASDLRAHCPRLDDDLLSIGQGQLDILDTDD